MATSGGAVKQRQLVRYTVLIFDFGSILLLYSTNSLRPGTVAFPACSTLEQPLGHGESPPYDQRPSGVYAWTG